MGNRIKYKKNGNYYETIKEFKVGDAAVEAKITEVTENEFQWSVRCGTFQMTGIKKTKIKAMKSVRENLDYLGVGLKKEEKPYRRKRRDGEKVEVKPMFKPEFSRVLTKPFSWDD
jgi:hypothetical protein